MQSNDCSDLLVHTCSSILVTSGRLFLLISQRRPNAIIVIMTNSMSDVHLSIMQSSSSSPEYHNNLFMYPLAIILYTIVTNTHQQSKCYVIQCHNFFVITTTVLHLTGFMVLKACEHIQGCLMQLRMIIDC